MSKQNTNNNKKHCQKHNEIILLKEDIKDIFCKSDSIHTISDYVKELVEKKTKGKQNMTVFLSYESYPIGADTSQTREIIRAIKDSGNYVKILSETDGVKRDFDLLDNNDWVGVLVTGNENKRIDITTYEDKVGVLMAAKAININTWVSYKVMNQEKVLQSISALKNISDKIEIDRYPDSVESFVSWRGYRKEVEKIINNENIDCVIKGIMAFD